MGEHEHSDWTTTVEADPKHEGLWIETNECNVCGTQYIFRMKELPEHSE